MKKVTKTILALLVVATLSVGVGVYDGGIQLFNGKPPRPEIN